jgi:hypothetical protein
LVLEEERCAVAAFIWLEFLDKVELHPSGMCVQRAFPWSQQPRRKGIEVIRLSRAWGKGQALNRCVGCHSSKHIINRQRYGCS